MKISRRRFDILFIFVAIISIIITIFATYNSVVLAKQEKENRLILQEADAILSDEEKITLDLINEYRKLYEGFKNLDYDHKLKKQYYYDIREEYNQLRRENSKDKRRYIIFYWLMRNCFNGLIRYNKYGDFNASCHYSRNGMQPEKIEKIFEEWNILLNKYDVQLFCCSYDDLPFPYNIIQKDDLVYCDPPYMNTGSLYDYDKIDYGVFFEWLKKLPCKYLLSFDGFSGDTDNRYFDIQKEIYDKIEYISSGTSSFKRLVKGKLDEVYDSLYIKEAK